MTNSWKTLFDQAGALYLESLAKQIAHSD
ncbi:uncharacterized protein METZ01_LOCUS487466, partial [marine metagenome]